MDQLKEFWPVLALLGGWVATIAVMKHQVGQIEKAFTGINARLDKQDDKLEEVGKVCVRLETRMESQEKEFEWHREKYSFQGFTKGSNGQ